MTITPEDLYRDRQQIGKAAARIAPQVEGFVQRLLGLSRDECSKGHALDFSAEIAGCHHPLTDQQIAHINRVVVGHLMLRHNLLAYFSDRLGPAFSTEERSDYERSLQVLADLVRGGTNASRQRLKQQLVFALAILHDVGKTRLLEDSGHEERAGELVEQVLERLQRPLSLKASDVVLGRKLVENHTMLGTLVQGERSAHEVYRWLRNSIKPPLSHERYLAYLLLLNGMDVAGYRHTPIIMTPYWLERYVELSSIAAIKELADAPLTFAERRLCELARGEITDVGDEPYKAAFHRQVRQELRELERDTRATIGTMWIRDALYFIIRVNEVGIRQGRWNEKGGWSERYAKCYVRLFQALAQIALQTNAETTVFRHGSNIDPRQGMPAGVDKLLERLVEGSSLVSGAFRQERQPQTVEFTINEQGLLCSLDQARLVPTPERRNEGTRERHSASITED